MACKATAAFVTTATDVSSAFYGEPPERGKTRSDGPVALRNQPAADVHTKGTDPREAAQAFNPSHV